MYAYVLDIGRGFSKVCVDKGNQPHAFRDPRPCCRSRIVLRKHHVGVLLGASLYSLLRWSCTGHKPQGVEMRVLRPDRGEAMQGSGCELRRIHPLGTSVNKGNKKDRRR